MSIFVIGHQRIILTGVLPIRVKIGDFPPVTLKFDGWPWKTIWHLFYATLCFVHHYKAIGEFILGLRSGNTQFGPKSVIFVTRDLEISWMTLKNKMALLLYHLKQCVSFQSHWWIQTGDTVRKRFIWVKIGDFLPHVTLKFDGWPWKTTWHLFYAASSFVNHFIAIIEFKLELQSGNTQCGSKSMIFLAVWPWNLTDDLEKQSDTSSKYHQALCVISSPYVNSNWSYSPETAKLGIVTSVTLTFDLWLRHFART